MTNGLMGVNFQPGVTDQGQPGGGRPGGSGVQEAIKILSLRLPKVVGAQGLAPLPLLTSPGAEGRAERVVEDIWRRMNPAAAKAPGSPVLPVLGPSSPFESTDIGPQRYQSPAPSFQPEMGGPESPFEAAPRPKLPRFTPGIQPPGDLPGGVPPNPLYETPVPLRSVPDFHPLPSHQGPDWA